MALLADVIGAGDELPGEFNHVGTTPKCDRTIMDINTTLVIPKEIDEIAFHKEIGSYGRKLVRKEGGINQLLSDYHNQTTGIFQDFLSEKLPISSDFANKLGIAVIIAYQDMIEIDDNDSDGVEELNF